MAQQLQNPSTLLDNSSKITAFDQFATENISHAPASQLTPKNGTTNNVAMVNESMSCISRLKENRTINPYDDCSSLIKAVDASPVVREAVLNSEQSHAQNVIDSLQEFLDNPSSRQLASRRGIIRFLVQIASRSNLLPSSLFLRDTSVNNSRDPTRIGSSADVYLGRSRQQEVALKRPRGLLSHEKPKFYTALCREALVWRQLRHENVLPFLGIDAVTFKSVGDQCIVTPWRPRGTLRDYLISREYNPSQHHQFLLLEIARGISYLHSENIVHGDLKDTNILLDDNGHPQIADFGLAMVAEATLGRSVTLDEARGTSRWISPEWMEANPGTRRLPSGDVYAFGLLCVTMFTRKVPFSTLSDVAIVRAVLAGRRPDRAPSMPDTIWQLAQSCWHQSPNNRPAMKDAMATLNTSESSNLMVPRPGTSKNAQDTLSPREFEALELSRSNKTACCCCIQ